MSTNSAPIRFYVKTADTSFYLICAGYGSAKWTPEFDEATEFWTAEEADRALRIAAPLEEEPLQVVRLPGEAEDDDDCGYMGADVRPSGDIYPDRAE